MMLPVVEIADFEAGDAGAMIEALVEASVASALVFAPDATSVTLSMRPLMSAIFEEMSSIWALPSAVFDESQLTHSDNCF